MMFTHRKSFAAETFAPFTGTDEMERIHCPVLALADLQRLFLLFQIISSLGAYSA